jgi:putative ABC transport system substrate-binding protein
VVGTDPVGLGLVSSLNRPGGNVTGITFVTTTLGAKRLDLLRQLVPTATVVGLLVNPANPTSKSQANDVQAATRALGLELVIVDARSEREIEAAFSSFAQGHVNAIVLGGDGFFLSRRDQLVELAARHAIPVMYYLREYAAAGGLISYGTNMSDAYRLGGLYLGRILKGEKPSELPVQQSVNYELVINLKTAKALGLAVPLTMQATADEIIEAP